MMTLVSLSMTRVGEVSSSSVRVWPILLQAMLGLGSPDTEQVTASLDPVSFTTEPPGWSLTWGREWMMSWAVTSTWPARFSARHR